MKFATEEAAKNDDIDDLEASLYLFASVQGRPLGAAI